MSLNIVNHKNVLLRILKSVFTDPQIGPILGFKGGTAAFLFHELSRFSVDLDFDLLDKTQENLVFEHMKTILEKFGKLKEVNRKRFNLFFLLSYDDKEINAQNVKIEINRRDFGSKFEVKSYLGIAMKVMVGEDIVAHKLVAMIERFGRTNRDIFDVYFFLQKNFPINEKIVENRTHMTFKKFLAKSVQRLKKISHKNILSGMGELLDAKQKQWAKEHLLEETIFLLKLKLQKEK